MNCPDCGRGLRDLEYEGAHIMNCDSCGGEFIGPDQMVRIIRAREESVDPALQAYVADWKPLHGLPDDERRRELVCPGCAGTMRLINYAGDSGVFVDRCDACSGLWLDHLELEKIQALLERWADEAPEQIDALSRQLEDARLAAHRDGRFNFRSSRFSFVNALLSRLLDAA